MLEPTTIPNYRIVQYVNMPETISKTIFLLLNTQTVPKKQENIRIIQDNDFIDKLDYEEELELQKNNEKVNIKINITKISKHLPNLIFDEYDDNMEE